MKEEKVYELISANLIGWFFFSERKGENTTVCQISAKLLSAKAIAPLLRVSVSLNGEDRGVGGVGIVTGSYFNSRRTFSSRMKYQIYRSLRRSETGMSDIEKLASR